MATHTHHMGTNALTIYEFMFRFARVCSQPAPTRTRAADDVVGVSVRSLIAACIHDFKHPGRSNAFEVNSETFVTALSPPICDSTV